MKKEKSNVSRIVFRNTLTILWVLILIFFTVITISILAFEAGFYLKQGQNPFKTFSYFLIVIFIIFAIVIYCIYRKNKKIINLIKKMEEATEEVAKGNFKIQLELCKDARINSFVNNFNKMVKELDNKETLQEDFISNVSHEFKTPLSVIQSYSKSLRRKGLDNNTKKQYEEILDSNIKKLTNLTSNILNLAKLENQEIILDKKEFLLDEQIRQTVVSFQPEWSKKNIEFDLNLPKTTYFGSEELISQIWQNIISNAIKYSFDDGKIKISLKLKEEEIFVSISDNGIGMSKEVCEKIFNKFYQADTSHSGEGNGLGLALVKRILKICDGDISVKSEANKGSTFIVKLKINKK